MADFLSVAATILILVITIYYLWRLNVKTYRLPPGPKQNLIFGSLLDLIWSTLFKKEPAFLKLAKWSFQVKKFFLSFVVCFASFKHLTG